jgi:hypothetical protein
MASRSTSWESENRGSYQSGGSLSAVCLHNTQLDDTEQFEITFVSGHSDVCGGFQKLIKYRLSRNDELTKCRA